MIGINSLNENYTVKNKLGRSCYLIIDKITKIKYTVKLEPQTNGKLHSIFRQLVNGSLPFQNEFRVNNEILKIKRLDFKIPEIIDSQTSLYFLSNFINQKKINNTEYINDSLNYKICLALLSIAKIKRPIKWNFFKELTFRFMESPSRRILIDVHKACRSNNLSFFKAFKLILKLEFIRFKNIKKVPPNLIHNDLGFNNILIDHSNQIFIIDWEDALWEKKWPLVDITDLVLNVQIGNFNKHLLVNYFDKIKNRYPYLSDSIIECHIKFGYLRRLSRLLSMKKTTIKEKKIILNKFKYFINNESSFIFYKK